MLNPWDWIRFLLKSIVDKAFSDRLAAQMRIIAVKAAEERFACEMFMLGHLMDSLPRRKMPSIVHSSSRDVALAMNMANNLFNLSIAARQRGWNAELILWPDVLDCSVFADPRWEIEALEIASEDAMRGDRLTTAYPENVVDVRGLADDSSWRPSLPGAEALLGGWVGYEAALPYLQAIRRHELLLASGPAIAMAPFAEIPFVTFATGGDLYITPFENHHLARLMRAGWRRANAHVFSGAHFYRFAEDLGLSNIVYIPVLVDTDRYAPSPDRKALHERALHEFGCEMLFFAGARHDWEDKGTAKIISAIESLRGKPIPPFKVLFASWGREIERTKRAIRKRGLGDICVFLPTLSKPRLRYWMMVADAVLDQFSLGEYGTLSLESMAMGRPVILYYAHRNPLPVLSAFHADEIAARMLWVLENPEDADALGARARDWVIARHGPDIVLPKFEAVFRSVLNNEALPKFEVLMEA